jgi:TatD DNase family protein
LYLNQFDEDRDEMILRAVDSGVDRMLVPGLDLPTSKDAITLSKTHPEIYAAVGIHPNSATKWTDDSYEALKKLSQNEKVVAIGEIGLDYYWDLASPELQKEILDKQLKLAAETHLPVILHNRDSTEDLVKTLVTWQEELVEIKSPLAQRPGVVHSFSGGEKAAGELIARNFFIGITGPVTFKKAGALRALVAALPIDRILIETDAPYLTPHPYRGKRNEPSHVRFVAEKIAEVRSVSVSEIVKATAQNAARLFGWKAPSTEELN